MQYLQADFLATLRAQHGAPKVRELSDEEALRFWHSAQGATPFTHPEVLAALSPRALHLGLSLGDQLCALWPLALDACGRVHKPPFAYYLGPYWSNAVMELNPRKRLEVQILCYRAFLERIFALVESFRASVAPDNTDLRGLMWSAQDMPNVQLQCLPRYTALLPKFGERSAETMAKDVGRRVARYIKHTERLAPLRECTPDAKAFAAVYAELLDGRIEAGELKRRLEQFDPLLWLVGRGHGHASINRLSAAEGEAYSIMLLLQGNGFAFCVVHAANTLWRGANHMSWDIWQAIALAKTHGCHQFDFNGANSAQRALNKHGYGGEAALYFDLELTRA
jgi:hypothetical protein